MGYPRKWSRSQKQHHPHTASQNNGTPFRSYLLQPAETPTLGTELSFLTQRKHPGISDGCICFNNHPQAKCHCRVSSILIILKVHWKTFIGRTSQSSDYLASCSCSAVEELLEKQHIDNSLQDLYFLVMMMEAELPLSQAQEPNGLLEPQGADSQGSGWTASLKAPLGWLQEESSQHLMQQLSSVMQVAALVEQDLAVVLVTQRKLPLVVYWESGQALGSCLIEKHSESHYSCTVQKTDVEEPLLASDGSTILELQGCIPGHLGNASADSEQGLEWKRNYTL